MLLWVRYPCRCTRELQPCHEWNNPPCLGSIFWRDSRRVSCRVIEEGFFSTLSRYILEPVAREGRRSDEITRYPIVEERAMFRG